MTTITLRSPHGRIAIEQRRTLAKSLTEAVLKVEVGQLSAPARAGFQVWFREFDTSEIAIGGVLLCDQSAPADIVLVEIVVMDGHWPETDRARVIRNIYGALAAALDRNRPPPGWWVTFKVIDEGSWGSRGDVLSILDLLGTGVFAEARADLIREAIGSREVR